MSIHWVIVSMPPRSSGVAATPPTPAERQSRQQLLCVRLVEGVQGAHFWCVGLARSQHRMLGLPMMSVACENMCYVTCEPIINAFSFFPAFSFWINVALAEVSNSLDEPLDGSVSVSVPCFQRAAVRPYGVVMRSQWSSCS